ncbi:response regulator [Geopsychrobacter electrodiphilus]|uniref:response regulator n=1 Tax=Geopsychrobacter electrodiphilus TaxID=225196 RepID=UPI0003A45AFB|nr:response regulator [Geopsychrobacter electrodiphilus]
MILQCPDCATRYRIKDMTPGRPAAKLICPNCSFHFTLIAPKAEGELPSIQSGARVLLVDDAHFFREMLADLLLPLNLNLLLAATAEDALMQLNQHPCDLMLLDLNLPDKNGRDLIREIRANSQIGKIRILAMSGVFRREEDGMDAIRAGADAFINKSFRPEDLREKVRKLLAR